MTTIAISEGVVAVDSQLTGGNHAVRAQKLMRLPDGGVAVGAGLWRNAYAGLMWLVNGERGEPPDLDGATIVIVRPDKSIWIAEESFPAYPILDTDYAAGCGADMARLLMAQGKSPVQAVAEACELDAMSSAPIFSMAVLSPQEAGPTVHMVEQAPRRASKPARKRK